MSKSSTKSKIEALKAWVKLYPQPIKKNKRTNSDEYRIDEKSNF